LQENERQKSHCLANLAIKVAQNSFLFFWSFLELDAIFQAWNCTVLNACAIYLR